MHTFPEGYRPQPKVSLSAGAVVSFENDAAGKIARIIVEKGSVDVVNVPGASVAEVKDADLTLPPTVEKAGPVQVLAPEVMVAGVVQKFGVEAVPVILKPGVKVSSTEVSKTFAPAAFNPDHTRYIARSVKAKPMAVNMYSAFWSLMVCLAVTIGVSLVTKPKPDSELKNLVMGLTQIPDEGPVPWYTSPKLWAGIVFVVLVAVNIMFW